MKSSRTNSFRLHRVSRASSLKKQSQTFYVPDQTFKLSAINSVTRGIKHTELSFITGDDLNKLRVEPIITNDGFYDSAHQSLTQVRKKYDEAKKQRVDADENIIKLKADIRKYKIIEQEYEQKKNQGEDTVMNLEKSLQDKKLLLEETIMQKNVLLNMRKRLHFDKVVYDQRKFNLEKEYSFQNKQISVFKRDGFFAGEERDRTQKVREKFLNELNAENIEREQHLKNLQSMIEQKQRCNQHNVARGHEIYEIAERALQDKDPNQKQWHQIYLTNVFVSKLLRNKIDKEMQKFSIVEFAFKNIKTATGVSDAKTLIHKFLNKEAQYGDLLGRITINEKRISELKQERQFLLQEQKDLEMEKETLLNSKVKNVDISNQLKNYSHVSDHERKMETYLSKIAMWLNKQAKKLNSIEKTAINFQDSKKKDSIKNNFVEYCHILENLLAKCEKSNIQDSSTATTDISARDTARLTRIVPKRSRKNSMGQDIFDVDEEELAPTNQYEQKQMVNSQRDEIVRANQKFMKEARKRLEERRKLNIQRQGEKKDKKVVEIKKEQD